LDEVRFLAIIDNEVHAGNLFEIRTAAFSVAAQYHDAGLRIATMRLPQEVARFTVGYMGYAAGVQDIDVGYLLR
jgi:hypothetical protein